MTLPIPTDGAKPADDAPDAPDQPDDQTPAETPEERIARLEKERDDLKAHSRKHEQRAKDNKAAADELARIKAAEATPDQRLALAEERAAKAEARLARSEVALETGLPANLASLLNGTEDEMREQAQALLAFKGETPAPTPPARQRPAPDPSQGGSTGTKVSAADEGKAEAQRRIAARKSRKS